MQGRRQWRRLVPNVRTLCGDALAVISVCLLIAGCDTGVPPVPVLHWYVFAESSGAFAEAAARCTRQSGDTWRIEMVPLPTDADQQHEQLARRLAAEDRDIDIIGMDVIWTAEFATAGWIHPWPESEARQARVGRLEAAVASASYNGRLWAMPFTTNTQLLWYRSDRMEHPPQTWNELITMAEALGEEGTIQAQGERYEGLTVFFVSLLASAGGAVLNEEGDSVALPQEPALQALRIMRRLATSPAAAPGLANAREDQARLAFEAGDSSFMLNYTYVWPSARRNAPEVARHMAWARWPAVEEGHPSRVTIGGINLGIGAFSRHPDLARKAATCIASRENQAMAAARGGLPPTITALYDEPRVRAVFPFADLLRETLKDAVQRPQTPFYNDLSLAISHTLHPMAEIEPQRELARLRKALGRALRSEGLL